MTSESTESDEAPRNKRRARDFERDRGDRVMSVWLPRLRRRRAACIDCTTTLRARERRALRRVGHCSLELVIDIAVPFAEMVREEVARGNVVIAAGDMNDFASSVCDVNCNRPISAVESLLRDAGGLVNVATAISDIGERYASWWNCAGDCAVSTQCLSMIDHVLLSGEGCLKRRKKYEAFEAQELLVEGRCLVCSRLSTR